MEEIAYLEEAKYKKISAKLAKTKDGEKIDPQKFWKIRKAICPRSQDPPSVVLDSKGNNLTSQESIENRAIEVYKERLDGNEIKPHLKEAEKTTNELCESRLKVTANKKTKPWTMDGLDNAIKDLSRNKSRDALG